MLQDKEIGRLFTSDIVETPDADALVEIFQKGKFGAARMGAIRTIPVVEHVFTQQELLNIATHPVTLIPAPGAGQAILITDGYFIQDTTAGGYSVANSAGAYATAVLTMAANAVASDQIILPGSIYTFVDPGPFTSHHVPVGLTTAETIANIVAAVNGTDGQSTPNIDVTAAAGSGVVNFTIVHIGSAQNTDAASYTNSGAGTNHFGAPAFTGGVDPKDPVLIGTFNFPYDASLNPGIILSATIPERTSLKTAVKSFLIIPPSTFANLPLLENTAFIVYLQNGFNGNELVSSNMTGGTPDSLVYVQLHYFVVPTNVVRP